MNDLLGFKAHIVFPTTAFDKAGAKTPEIFGVCAGIEPGLGQFLRNRRAHASSGLHSFSARTEAPWIISTLP